MTRSIILCVLLSCFGLANETNRNVWFDDLSVQITPSQASQENHYSPFGLNLAGIEKNGRLEHLWQYQGKEKYASLMYYDFGSRYYDPQLGKWHATDPQNQFASPYLALGNNPISSIDPDGELAWFVPIIIGAAIGGISQGISSKNNGGTFFGGFWKGALVGAAAGATGIGTTALASGTAFTAGVTASTGFGAIVAGGTASGFVSGGLTSSINGGSFLGGAWRGAVNGLVGAGLGTVGGSINSFAGQAGIGIGTGAATGALSAALSGGDIGQGALIGGAFGGAFAAVTSPQLSNAVRGQGFRSNDRVLARFVGRGEYQEALDYFGFRGKYDPSQTQGNPGVTKVTTGEIFYADNAFGFYDENANFTANYHQLRQTVDHELFHQNNILSGKYLGVEITQELHGLEEHGAYIHTYKRMGFYPSARSPISGINRYGLQADIYGPPNNFFKNKWWHFIYKIPRRY